MIVLEANYSKKLGLPGYSSHQYSLTIRKEVADISKVEQESRELFRSLQDNVDRDIQQTGYLPTQIGNGHHNGNGNGKPEMWACSPKQKELILKIVEENKLDKAIIENLSKERFEGTGVKFLNTLQASMLIKELMDRYPRQDNGHGRNGKRSPAGTRYANSR